MNNIYNLLKFSKGITDIKETEVTDYALFLCRIKDDWDVNILPIIVDLYNCGQENLAYAFLFGFKFVCSDLPPEEDDPIMVDLIKSAMDNFSLSPECYDEDEVKGFLDYIFTIRIYSRWCDSLKDIYNAAPEYVKTLFAKKYISVFGGFEA